MKRNLCIAVVGLSLMIQCLVTACDSAADRALPETICGTPVTRRLVAPLVAHQENLHEFSRVSRRDAVTGPCVLLSGNRAILGFRFSWDHSPTDLMYLATGTGTVSRVTGPRYIDSVNKTIVGSDGAISQAPCKTKNGNYFTLTLQLPLIKVADRSRRGDIERFMRVYFPATVATLGCS
ncbi:hypothetical protein [Streptomyces sp. NPDC051452]|uniref:hypothetical protein n=1 Tax=Streptomyces sp. NPDC051452 TaxID=3365654 RepID=UPI00379081D9